MKRNAVMKRLVVACSVVCLVFLSGTITSSEFYSEDQAISTLAHARPAPDERPNDGQMERVIPAMADLMDQTGTIAVHVGEKDFEKAEEDLAHYMEASHSFNNLVVSLDMTESDIKAFAEGNMENMDALATLIEKSRQMDELSRLEVIYKDEKNSETFYSISYEGEALQMKMEEALQHYRGQEATMAEFGTKYDLPVASYTRSLSAFAGVVNETDRTRQAWRVGRDDNRPAPGLSITPRTVSYGDAVLVSGTVSGTSAGPLSLFLDGREWTTATPDQAGRYAATVPASSLSAGRHLIYAVHDGAYSDVAEFEVLAAPVDLTLEAGPLLSWGGENVVCRGTLFCEGDPVEGAMITVTSDDGTTLKAETDGAGVYSCTGRLDPGLRELRALVSHDRLPIQSTVSETVEVEAPEPSAWVTAPVMKTAAILLLGIGGTLAVRRRQARHHSRGPLAVPRCKDTLSRGVWPGTAQDAVVPPGEWTSSQVEERYADLVSGGRYGDAIRLLYLTLAARIGKNLQIRNYTALTPREVLGIATASAPARSDGLPGFIRAYEKVRYGRPEPSYEQTQCLHQLYDHTSGQGGDED